MLKIKLKDNLRYFDTDDTDFSIVSGQVKELSPKYMKSYSIKLFLFTGRFEVMDGDVLFTYKSALIYISPEGLYGLEDGKFFTKDFEMNTLTFLEESEVPKEALAKLTNSPLVIAKETVVVKPKEDGSIDTMTKKELLAYAKKKMLIVDESLKIGDLRDEIKALMKSF